MMRHPTFPENRRQSLVFRRLVRRLTIALVLLAGLALLISAAQAANVLSLRDGTEHYALGRHLVYLEDKSGRLTLDDIIEGKADKPFAPIFAETPNFGFTESAYWLRLDLANLNSPISEWLLETQYPLLDRIDLYLVYPGNRIVSSASGDTLPFSQRALKHRHFISEVVLDPGSSVTLFMRVKSEGAVTLPLSLWSMKKLFQKDHE